MFGVVPKPLWSGRIVPDDRNRIPLAMRCLLLEDGDRLILIDNGIGDKFDEKFRDIYDVSFEDYSLEGSLRRLGFGLDEVSDVGMVGLYHDANENGIAEASEQLATGSYASDDGQIVFTLPSAHPLTAGAGSHFLVTYGF